MTSILQLGFLLLFSVIVQHGDLTPGDHSHMTFTQEDKLQEDGVPPGLCRICKIVTSKVLRIIGKSLSKDNIDSALDGICRKVGLQVVCRRFIRQYRQKLIDAISKRKDANAVCRSLKLCQNGF
ncbi:uncharacterized protein [Salminus brasiliensis]|uniref:uncharacterized protein n=1 Tax=Salminus brasiliensis TaxID=930266 RepID=UPI003B82DAF2